jgi:type III restriction enzyme
MPSAMASEAAGNRSGITGDDYESGRGVREERRAQKSLEFRDQSIGDDPIHINIFNISKINSEVRGGRSPRIKRLQEYIGDRYFSYLAGLDDLVLLMDESHRYRASAGIKAINELQPILGLELTATPQIERGGARPKPFENVIYSYPLAAALDDGSSKFRQSSRARTSKPPTTTKLVWKT